MHVHDVTIAAAAKALRSKEYSSVELTQSVLDRIHERNTLLNAFISVHDEQAIAAARLADERLQAGDTSALLGIPYSVKDAICTKNIRSTASARILDTYTPPFQATVINKIEQAGAVLVGKNNCDAFGHGASNENSMYGPVKNPHDPTKVSGGSSGGSAAAVADGQSVFSIAEDTGGSIRQPASLCGIVGLRPSYGLNSRYGIMPMASSLDTVGPMAKTVEDIAYIMEVMAGHDPKDATSVNMPVPTYTKELTTSPKGLRIGIPKEYFELEGMEAETKHIIEQKLEAMKELGVTLVPVSLPHTKYAIAIYYIVVPSEDSSNLGRIDGIRYGVQVDMTNGLRDVYEQSRASGLPPEVKRRIMIGTYALSAGSYDAYYRKAQKVRTLVIRDFNEVFRDVDVIATPTSPFPAFGIGEKANDVLAMYLADIFMSPGAVAGIPGLSLPAGMTKTGLPVGMQLMGPRLSESKLFSLGYHIEQQLQ